VARSCTTAPVARAAVRDVNCAALTETLLESELFGHRRGAYTGADRDPRAVRAGRRGTLFLDEIGEMPMHSSRSCCARSSSARSAAGEDMPRQVDVRIVAATNRELAAAVREGGFRETCSTGSTSRAFISPRCASGSRTSACSSTRCSRGSPAAPAPGEAARAAALRLFLRHDWPGNVRELEHELTKLAASSTASLITELDVLENCAFHERAARAPAPEADRDAEETEVEQIRQALRAAKGNRSRAAEIAGDRPLDPLPQAAPAR